MYVLWAYKQIYLILELGFIIWTRYKNVKTILEIMNL